MSAELENNSNAYNEFLAERNEILRHMRIRSQKVGKKIGFEEALLDWVSNHRQEWRQSRREQHNETAGVS